MTFLEAAIEVLRREGRPLPPKRLAELAVKHNLLSVVGRDPEGTMAERLDAHLAKDAFRSDLVRLQAGLYGLKAYPPRPEVVEAEPDAKIDAKTDAKIDAKVDVKLGKPDEAKTDGNGESTAEAKPATGEDGARRGRSRRRRRPRGANGAATDGTSDNDQDDAEEMPKSAVAAEPAPKPIAAAAAPVDSAAAAPAVADGAEAPTEERRARRRSRRGARGRRDEDPTSEAAPDVVGPAASEPAVDAGAEPGDMEQLDEEFGLSSGPVMAPTHGAEETFRSDDDRVLRDEIPGRPIGDDRGPPRHRRDRDRSRRGGRPDRPQQAGARGNEAKPERGPRPEHKRDERPPQSKPLAVAPSPGRVVPVLDAVVELFRQSDARPQSVAQLAEALMKGGRVDTRGGHGEVVRQVRAALVRDGRERENEGLRPRFLNFGGGLFVATDKRLESELLPIERELAERAARLRDATKATLRRRLPKLAPAAFEALGRALLDKLGLSQVELVRRGDGVAYFGAIRAAGVASVKVLIGIRSGDAEISARAVGELKAGMQVRGYDEGLLLCAGRPAAEAAAELKSSASIQVHDGLSVAQLLQKNGLGVRRLMMPVDYLDLELLHELTEA